MKSKIAFLPLISFCFGPSAWASTEILLKNTFPRSTAHCALSGKQFEIILAGNTQIQDDEEKAFGPPYIFVKEGKQSLLVSEGGKFEDSYSFIAPVPKSLCDHTEAVEATKAISLILFSRDNRPMANPASIFAYDVTSHQIHELHRDIGVIKKLEAHGHELEFNTTSELETTDGGTVKINGKSVQYGGTEELEPWSRARWSNNHIEIEQDLKLTWEKSPWKSYFKDQEQFAKAAGWNSREKKFSNLWVLVAGPNYDLGIDCILLSGTRQANPNAEWACKKLSR